MAIGKKTTSHGMPWEREYGYAQSVQVRDTIYLSGQVSHDDKGNIVGPGNMEIQMRQAYTNIQKVLGECITLCHTRCPIRTLVSPLSDAALLHSIALHRHLS